MVRPNTDESHSSRAVQNHTRPEQRRLRQPHQQYIFSEIHGDRAGCLVKRFLITPGKLRVSLPGFDVTTANLDQMAFDERFASIGQAVKGSVAIAGGLTPNSAYPHTQTVLFGRSFPFPPFFVGTYDAAGFGGIELPINGQRLTASVIGGGGANVFAGANQGAGVHAQVSDDRALLLNYSSFAVTVYWKAFA